MTTLDFPGQPPVTTDDAQQIATLTRKGWTIRPDPPTLGPMQTVRWDGGQWLLEQLPPPPPIVVSPLQARIALAQAGLLEAIESAVAAMPTTSVTRLAWEWATQFDESSPTLISMCNELGISAEQRRALLEAASQVIV